MTFEELNHVAVHVADVDKSRKFYSEVLQLKTIPRPAFTFPGEWFRLGKTQELHLIGDRTKDVVSHNRGTHFALLVDDIDAWEKHLKATGYPAFPRQRRPDGAWQIFLIDPDGHYIELCSKPGTADQK